MVEPGSEWRVLLVDDEPEILRALSTYFARLYPDGKILTAPSGEAALDLLAREDPDVVVSDFRMPGMDGATLLARARDLRPHAARMLLTGHADLDVVERCVNEGHVHAFQTKPTQLAALGRAVTSLLEKTHAERVRADAFARASPSSP